MVLYNDRVFCYEKLAELEPTVRRQAPDDQLISEFIELDIRNQLAFMELDHFQSSGQFLCQHSLTSNRKAHNELEALRKNNPERFANELVSCTRNITRYNSQLKHKKYKSKKEKQLWIQSVEDFTKKKQIMEKLLAGA